MQHSPNIDLAPYMVLAWNVNGYSAGVHEWLLNVARTSRPDIIFLGETKKREAVLAPLFAEFNEYNVIINAHEPAQWHGVAMLIRKNHKYERVPIQMNIQPRSDTKTDEAATGRIIAISLNAQMYIIGSYTPNSGGRDAVKLAYRVQSWDPAFTRILEQLRANGPTMWIGDINVAPDNIDTSNPKTMSSWAGCSPQERANFRTLIQTGNWIDVWRHQHPTERAYSWCGTPRRPNYGLRLDNIVVSTSLAPRMLNTFMIPACPISDHIPVGAYVMPN